MNDSGLPPDVAQSLGEFVEAAKSALGPDLASVVLFGSAAEGRLRATSDVNLIVVLSRFDSARADLLREPLRLAHAAIRLSVMFILEDELPAAAESFAVKFADIRERHIVLAGNDPFAGLALSRSATLGQLTQILLNFILRTRERYLLAGQREEQLVAIIADAAGPLRAAAALLISLEGGSATSPKAALEALSADLDAAGWREPLANLSRAREATALPPGAGRQTVLYLLNLAQAMHARASGLS